MAPTVDKKGGKKKGKMNSREEPENIKTKQANCGGTVLNPDAGCHGGNCTEWNRFERKFARI